MDQEGFDSYLYYVEHLSGTGRKTKQFSCHSRQCSVICRPSRVTHERKQTLSVRAGSSAAAVALGPRFIRIVGLSSGNHDAQTNQEKEEDVSKRCFCLL